MNEPTLIRSPLDRLTEPAENPNVMGVDEYQLLVGAIRRVGFLQPVLARVHPEDTARLLIIDGVHRARAAREAGLTEVPVVVLEAGEAEAAALQIGMNKLRGELDLAKVADALVRLGTEGWTVEQMTVTGFGAAEIEALIEAAVPEENIFEGGGGHRPPVEEEDAPPKPFLLELEFASRQDLARAKRALKRAAGKGHGLGDGLLRMIDGE